MNPPTDEERKKIVEAHKKRILSILEPISVTPVEATDVRFRFSYCGMWIDCVAQALPAERLFVAMYRMPKDEEEKKLLEDAGQIIHEHPEKREEFADKYAYEYLMLDMPIEAAINRVIDHVHSKVKIV